MKKLKLIILKVNKTLIDPAVVRDAMAAMEITDLNMASIRQMGGIVGKIEAASGEEFLHLEMGVPGLAPSSVGVEAECEALRSGVASIYPPMDGIPALKTEASRFLKAFVETNVAPEHCIPTVGSMQATFAAFTAISQIDKVKDTILYIDPGFSVQKTQARVIGVKTTAFDIYNYRAEKLGPKLEEMLAGGNVAAIVYSNPNNPTWMCLIDSELETIGRLAKKYDVIVVEDLAYMAMDFRKDMGHPFEAPYQPSVSKYTDDYIITLSASKIFSYAGQRIAVMAISDHLFDRKYEGLNERYGIERFGPALIQAILYAISSGTSHTTQYALAAMFKAASDGDYNFVEEVREYGRRTRLMKDIFLRNGFNIIYDRDLDEPLSDGFFFTVGYKGVEGGELQRLLLHYGVSGIVLSTTGSSQQGLRVCSSRMKEHHYDMMEKRLKMFNEEYTDNGLKNL